VRHFKSLSNISTSSKNEEKQPFRENNNVSNIQIVNNRLAKMKSVDPEEKEKKGSLTRVPRATSKNKNSGGKTKIPLPQVTVQVTPSAGSNSKLEKLKKFRQRVQEDKQQGH
jgi:hypothetical protein